MIDQEPSALAAELRLVLGQLVRRTRRVDALPLGHAVTLGYLDRNGPMTTSDLAHAQHVRPQSMARTVGQLSEAGLVGFEAHPSDGRKTLVLLTQEGRSTVSEGQARRADWLDHAISAELSKQERQVLAAAIPLLGRMADLPE